MLKKIIRSVGNWYMETENTEANKEALMLAQNEILEGLQGGVFVYRISNGFLMRDIPSIKSGFGHPIGIPTLIYAEDEIGIANVIIAHQAASKLVNQPVQGELFGDQTQSHTLSPSPQSASLTGNTI